jgi:hypothetical protein
MALVLVQQAQLLPMVWSLPTRLPLVTQPQAVEQVAVQVASTMERERVAVQVELKEFVPCGRPREESQC